MELLGIIASVLGIISVIGSVILYINRKYNNIIWRFPKLLLYKIKKRKDIYILPRHKKNNSNNEFT